MTRMASKALVYSLSAWNINVSISIELRAIGVAGAAPKVQGVAA